MVCLKRDSNPYWLTKLSLTSLKVCLIGYCFSNTQKTSARLFSDWTSFSNSWG